MKIDILGLKEYLNCDTAFLVSIIEKFIEETGGITKNIETAAATEKWDIVKLNAHKMLSSVKIFEITDLVTLLEKIEIDAGSKSNIPQLKENIKKMLTLVPKVNLEMQTSLEELK